MKTKVNFIVPANVVGSATSGILVGEFNNWDKNHGVMLKKQKNGTLKTTVSLDVGQTYQYRYFLDDGRWVNDERVKVNTGEPQTENCVINVTVDMEDKKDDLTKIEGIGKKIAELLLSENIDSFEILSITATKTLRKILETGGSRFKSYDPSNWAAQAKLAANGKMDELRKLQSKLNKEK